jgi:REP element-mobilizing transposase RayT
MPQHLVSVGVHLVWATKRRQPWLAEIVRGDLYADIAGTVKNKRCRLVAIGGSDDHVHLYVHLGPETTVRSLVTAIKSNSTRWLKQRDPALRQFRWQRGFGAFGVDTRDDENLRRYIDSQDQVHRNGDHAQEMSRLAGAYAVGTADFTWD